MEAMSPLPALDDLRRKAQATNDCASHNQYYMMSNDPKPVPRVDPFGQQPDILVASRPMRPTIMCRPFTLKKTFLQKCENFLTIEPKTPNYYPTRHRKLCRPLVCHPIDRYLRRCTQDATSGFLVITCIISLVIFVMWTSMCQKGCIKVSRPAEDRDWFWNATFYEIFPASFQDTDGDGYGDFQGIIRRLDYIKALGVSVIRLNSIFSALDYPLEFEHIIDLNSPDPHLGRLQDLQDLITESHKRGLKVVLDLNPTVTSDQHTWALHWQRGIPGYEHFYASANRSKDPPEMENSEGPPPEDWELTQRTFGAHYVVNWSNPLVQEEYRKVLNFLVDGGVDGFYMKHLDKIWVHNYRHLLHIVTHWQKTLNGPYAAPFSSNNILIMNSRRCKRILIASSKFADSLAAALGNSSRLYKDILGKFDLLDYPILVGSGKEMAGQVLGLKSTCNRKRPVTMWHLGSADTFRMASRIEPRYNTAALYLLMMLPGANSIFYGDEIRLKDSFDPSSGRVYRGGQLSPMQWTSENWTAGFTDNKTSPWMPISASSSVETSRDHQLKNFIELMRFRKSVLHHFAPRNPCAEIIDPNVLVMVRGTQSPSAKRVLLAANFGDMSEDKQLPDTYSIFRSLMATGEPTRIRIRGTGFTISPGAAFFAEVRQKNFPPPTILFD